MFHKWLTTSVALVALTASCGRSAEHADLRSDSAPVESVSEGKGLTAEATVTTNPPVTAMAGTLSRALTKLQKLALSTRPGLTEAEIVNVLKPGAATYPEFIDFALHTQEVGQVFNVKDPKYGGPAADGTWDAAFAAALREIRPRAALDGEYSTLVIPGGTYRFNCPTGRCLNLEAVKRLRVLGNNSRLISNNPTAKFVDVVKAADVRLFNFQLSYDPLPTLQGKILSIAATGEGNLVQVRFEPSAEEAARQLGSASFFFAANGEPVKDVIPKAVFVSAKTLESHLHLMTLKALSKESDSIWVATVDFGVMVNDKRTMQNVLDLATNPALPNHADSISLIARTNKDAIRIAASENVWVTNVWIQSAPGMGVLADHSTDVRLSKIYVLPALIGGTLVSTNADAIHFKSNRGTLSLTDSVIAASGDDLYNVRTFGFLVDAVRPVEDDQQIMNLISQSGCDPRAGDRYQLVDTRTGALVVDGEVLEATPVTGKALCTVKLDKPFSNELTGSNYLLYLDRFATTTFARNLLGPAMGRVRIRNNDVVVNHSVFLGKAINSLYMGHQTHTYLEGPITSRVDVRQNLFWGSSEYQPYVVSEVKRLDQTAPWVAPVTREIRIYDNTFAIPATAGAKPFSFNQDLGISFRRNTCVITTKLKGDCPTFH